MLAALEVATGVRDFWYEIRPRDGLLAGGRGIAQIDYLPVDGGSAWPERAGGFLLQRSVCYLSDD